MELPDWKKQRDIRIANGETRTNFGWLTADQIDKGIEWGAVKWSTQRYKDLGVLSVRVTRGSSRSFNILDCWLAYVDKQRGKPNWFALLDRKDGISDVEVKGLFKSLTGIQVPSEGLPLF